MSILFDLPYYSREAHFGPYSGADSGSCPATPTSFPTTPTLAAREAAAAFERVFDRQGPMAARGSRHLSNKPPPTLEELRAHIANIYAGEEAMGEQLEGLLRAAHPDLCSQLAAAGAPNNAVQTLLLMRELALSGRAGRAPSHRSSSHRAHQVFAGAQGCTLRSEGDTYVFEAETPGIRKEDLKLEIIGRRLQLTVSEHQERPAPNTDANAEAGMCTDANSEEPSVEVLDEIEAATPAISPRTSAEETGCTAPQQADTRRTIGICYVALPPDADVSNIAVSYELGVLHACIARSTGGPAVQVPTPEAQAASTAKDKVKELREALRAAEREAVQAEMAARSAAVSARRLEAARRTVLVI